MWPADLPGRTSVRLALGFALLLIGALALAGGVAWGLVRQELARQEDQRILQTFDALALEASDGGPELAAAVDEQAAAVQGLSTILSLREASGRIVAGNAPAFAAPPGWSDLPAEAVGDARRDYRIFEGAVGTDRLVVGSDRAELRAVGDIILRALGWASVAVLAIALGGGAAIAAGVQVRMAAMEAAMDRLAQGDLAARLPDQGSGDLARLARGLNQALARLERLVEGMRQVSTDIAHDLRTPLGRLRLRVEEAAAAAEGTLLAPSLALALDEADGLDATFSGLLRIAQIEAGARAERFAALDLGEVMERLVEAYAGVAEDGGRRLTLAPHGAAPVWGDRDLLIQLFANLVENAIRHTPPGTAISCALVQVGGATVATVADDGPGIPEADRERALRRLTRLEASRTTPGHGLGLALVKAVADLHEARLTFGDARPGLSMTLHFPPQEPAP